MAWQHSCIWLSLRLKNWIETLSQETPSEHERALKGTCGQTAGDRRTECMTMRYVCEAPKVTAFEGTEIHSRPLPWTLWQQGRPELFKSAACQPHPSSLHYCWCECDGGGRGRGYYKLEHHFKISVPHLSTLLFFFPGDGCPSTRRTVSNSPTNRTGNPNPTQVAWISKQAPRAILGVSAVGLLDGTVICWGGGGGGAISKP